MSFRFLCFPSFPLRSFPFLLCDGSSDPISLTGGSIGDGLSTDSNPKLAGLLCGDGNSMCGICCITVTGCYFGDGSQLSGVSKLILLYSGGLP